MRKEWKNERNGKIRGKNKKNVLEECQVVREGAENRGTGKKERRETTHLPQL